MMSQARFNAVYSGMTSIAKKVYEAVPKRDQWGVTQILGELARTGIQQDHRTVSGCLSTLINAGLVQEPIKGQFCREPIRDKVIATKEPSMKSVPVTTPAPVAPPKNPIDRLGALAARVAAMAAELKELASDISDAAIDVEDQFEQNEASMGKVKQLQAILKSLGEA